MERCVRHQRRSPRHVWGSMHGVNGKHPDNTAWSFGTSVCRFYCFEESMFGYITNQILYTNINMDITDNIIRYLMIWKDFVYLWFMIVQQMSNKCNLAQHRSPLRVFYSNTSLKPTGCYGPHGPLQMSPASGMHVWEFKLTGRKAQFRISVFGSIRVYLAWDYNKPLWRSLLNNQHNGK